LSTPEKRAYRRYQDNLRIEKSVLETAINDGREEGMKEGLKEGLEKGRLEGMKEVAQNMRAKGLSLPQIAELMALSEEEVAQLLPGQPEE
jgi:predicted transposase/invertase (TIGR01784 family)